MMKIIDGSQGEGGGQIFRTSLTLAMCLGVPVQIKNIRAGRKKPGLLRQHLTCLNAAQKICEANVEGDSIGSQNVTFYPSNIKGGEYEFSVGSAGSTTLIFQTVLLPLLTASKSSALTLSGGTHNGMAPSYEFLIKSFLPIMQRMGCDIKTSLESYGFYPAGGGKWQAVINPNKNLKSLTLDYGGDKCVLKAIVLSSRVPQHVAQRALNHIVRNCTLDNENTEIQNVHSVGPGNMVSLQRSSGTCVNVFDSYGQKNVSAEKVANKSIEMLQRFEQAHVAVDEHLADQLLLPLVCGNGGSFTTTAPSQHLLTNIVVIEMFFGKRISLTKTNEKAWIVVVKGK